MIQHVDLTPEESLRGAWAAYLCQNTLARFTYMRELGMTDQQFSLLWSGREDISYGQNEGFWIGRESVYAACVSGPQKVRSANQAVLQKLNPDSVVADTAGMMQRQTLMSPLVEVAKDGQTAKGMWYCPGVTTTLECDGENHLEWKFVRFAADFILEGETWKLWHLFEGGEFQFEMGHAYIPATGMHGLPDATVYAPNPEIADMVLGKTQMPPYDLDVHVYDIDCGWSPYPVVPVPYNTFEETFTYGPEPFVEAKMGG